MAKYQRTRKCGCGECRFKDSSVPCVHADAKWAYWLWAKVPGSDEEETESETGVLEIIEELAETI